MVATKITRNSMHMETADRRLRNWTCSYRSSYVTGKNNNFSCSERTVTMFTVPDIPMCAACFYVNLICTGFNALRRKPLQSLWSWSYLFLLFGYSSFRKLNRRAYIITAIIIIIFIDINYAQNTRNYNTHCTNKNTGNDIILTAPCRAQVVV